MRTALLLALNVLATTSSFAASSAPHPFNETHAEVEYNPESGCLEVALRLDLLALEEALRLFTGHSVDVDKADNVGAIIQRYVKESFRVSERGRVAPLHWIGHETEANEGWLYFEIELARGPSGTVWENHVLFELDEEQRNTISYLETLPKRRARTLIFDLDHPQVVLDDAPWYARLRTAASLGSREVLANSLERAARRALDRGHRPTVVAVGLWAEHAARWFGDGIAYRETVTPHLDGDTGAAARALIGYARRLRSSATLITAKPSKGNPLMGTARLGNPERPQ